MSDRRKDVCAYSERLSRKKEWRKDSEDTLPDLKEAKKVYEKIKIPEELGNRIRREIVKRKK